MSAAAAPEIIEGSFTLVSSRDVPFRRSPNRQRLAARILFWNFALLVAVVGAPLVL